MNDSSSREKRALGPEPPPPAQEAFLNLVRAHEKLYAQLQQFFAEHGVTLQQFNVLRILYVRDDGLGLSCHEIGERLLNRVPDITRLLDRLEKAGLVDRFRSKLDRRVVLTRLTDEGHDLVERIHPALMTEHDLRLSHLAPEEIEQLNRLLRRVVSASDDD